MTCKKLICILFAFALCLQLAACTVSEIPGGTSDAENNGTSNGSESNGVDSGIKTYTKPTSSDTAFAYNGSEIKFVPNGFNSNAMDISGNTATECGEYTAIISLKDIQSTSWADGTTDEISITWSITKEPTDYTVTKVSDGKLNVVSVDGDNSCSADITYPPEANYQMSQGGRLTFFYDAENDDGITFELSGEFCGSLAFDINEETDIEIELDGFAITAFDDCPIYISAAANADISAKKDTDNLITDKRAEAEDLKSAIYSTCDLKLKGAGKLTVTSQNNNGIHSKDDLDVQKLTLSVSCVDNALKGNDGVKIKSGDITLISRQGDGIKTSNSSVSSKGKQKGDVTIEDGKINIYAACDGIDAAHDTIINGGTLNIFTDKYSEYSEEVTAVSDGKYYIRATKNEYKYSICYYGTDETEYWVNADAKYETVNAGRENYYYYTVQKPSGYTKLRIFVYTASQSQGQANDYYKASDEMAVNDSYDTIAFGASMRPGFGGGNEKFEWTNYGTQGFGGGMGGPGMGGGMGGHGMGGMNEGNQDKGDHSTKGIKSANEINISGGEITVKAYDDAIHANADGELENGIQPTGNVTISGGTLTLSSNDDAIHADGKALVSGGDINILTSYEGIEGDFVEISGGNVSVIATDDGLNGTSTTGESIVVSGGTLYVYAGGDGVDSNSQSSYDGILFSGGRSVIISTGRGDSAIDTERGYKYTGGKVVAIGASGGMSSETVNCQNFGSVGSRSNVNLSNGAYLTVDGLAVIKMPCALSATAVVLGEKNAKISTASQSSQTLDANGVCWLDQ